MPDFARRLRRDLARKCIVVRSLVRESRSDSHATNVRFIPRTVKSPVVTNIYGDKISLIIWSEVPETILIENKEGADAYRSYFEFMLAHAKQKSR